jgi:hypothetical protein
MLDEGERSGIAKDYTIEGLLEEHHTPQARKLAERCGVPTLRARASVARFSVSDPSTSPNNHGPRGGAIAKERPFAGNSRPLTPGSSSDDFTHHLKRNGALAPPSLVPFHVLPRASKPGNG